MKKILAIALILTTVSIIPVSASVEHKVIKVIDGDTVYVDFNDNGIAEQDEKVRINGIDTFETKFNDGLNWQMKLYNLTQDEALGLGYYGKEFAKKELLNKPVRAEYTAEEKFDKNNRHLMSLYYDCNRQGKCKSYEQEVLKVGLATIYTKSNLAEELKPYQNLDKIKANAKKSHKLDLVVLNKKNGKYHKTSCKYGWLAAQNEIFDGNQVENFEKASCCFDDAPLPPQKINYYNFSEMQEGDIKIFFVDPLRFKRPQNNSVNELTASLLSLINTAKTSINFAIYGFSGEDDLMDALINAQKRGVIVQGITDKDIYDVNIYKDTSKLISMLKTIKTDYYEDKKTEKTEREKIEKYGKRFSTDDFDIRSMIMHDKFFVVDNSYVWTGSTNISENCMTYNANNSVLIKSKKVAHIYSQEFNQMYNEGKFHLSKKSIPNNENIVLNDKTKVSIYFSPQNKAINTKIVPLIDNAKVSIYTPIFYLTHKEVINSLIRAKKRGVKVFVILDANSAHNQFSKHWELRHNGIKVKTENWGGKMHMKSAIIDDKYLIIASMNWTNAAENRNDENTLIIENEELAKEFKKEFFYLWDSIPNKWLRKDPKAESKDSIGSCYDGVDNDHDGVKDIDDIDCKCTKKFLFH